MTLVTSSIVKVVDQAIVEGQPFFASKPSPAKPHR